MLNFLAISYWHQPPDFPTAGNTLLRPDPFCPVVFVDPVEGLGYPTATTFHQLSPGGVWAIFFLHFRCASAATRAAFRAIFWHLSQRLCPSFCVKKLTPQFAQARGGSHGSELGDLIAFRLS